MPKNGQKKTIAIGLLVVLMFQLFFPFPNYYIQAEGKSGTVTILEGATHLEEGFTHFILSNETDENADLSQLDVSLFEESPEERIKIEFPEGTLGVGEEVLVWLNEQEKNQEELVNFIGKQNLEMIEINQEQPIDVKGAIITSKDTEQLLMFSNDSVVEIEEENTIETDDESTSSPVLNDEQEQSENEESDDHQELEADIADESQELEVAEEGAIHHDPITLINAEDALTISVDIPEGNQVESGKLFFQTGKGMEVQEIALVHIEGEAWGAVLDQNLFWSPDFFYRIQVTIDGNDATFPAEGMYEAVVEAPEEDPSRFNELFITELVPDSANIGSSDAYEFIEIYNNTTEAIQLSQLQLDYHYPNGRVVEWSLPSEGAIPAQSPHTIWIHNGVNNHLSIEDFNRHYGSNLELEDLSIVYSDGMANSSERALSISYRGGEEQARATYFDEPGFDDTIPDKGIVYKAVPNTTSMKKVGLNERATPGQIQEGQVPKKAIEVGMDNEAPTIIHEPIVGEVDGESDSIQFEATVTDNVRVQSVHLLYKQSDTDDFSRMEMNGTGDDQYAVELPMYVFEAGSVYYQIEASDGVNLANTELYSFEVTGNEVDTTAVPELLVTELVPDSANIGSSDAYEFIEVYNNTNQPVSFEDYLIHYEYPAGNYLDWYPANQDIVIPPKEAIVFWIINGANGHLTIDDFNRNYGTNLVENEKVFRMHNSGMANGAERRVGIKTKTGDLISIAYYNDNGERDAAPDKGVVYRFPTDGTHFMDKVSSTIVNGTPGFVESWQVPRQAIQLEEDTVEPTISNETAVEKVSELEQVSLIAKMDDNQQIKRAEVHFKTDRHSEFQMVNLTNEIAPLYEYEIVKPNLIGAKTLEYYFVASDGTNTTTSETYTIEVESNWTDELRLNVNEGDVLSGTYHLKAAEREDSVEDLTISVDGTPLLETSRVIEHDAYFAFEVRGTNVFFQNGVVMDGDILEIFDDGYGQFTTLLIPISADRLKMGENVISIYSGSKASPIDIESPENRNDFDVKNVRLVLSDGTVLRDPVFSDPQELIDLGDDGTYRPFEDFTFTISEEFLGAQGYTFDTTLLEDGPHIIEAENTQSNEKTEVTILTDNTAPTISTSIEEGREYKGAFTIHVEAEDAIAGVDQVVVFLDGTQIETPYAASSAKLSPGEHTLKVIARDLVGNEAEKEVVFSVVEEHPNDPEQISEGAHLRVQVSDPTEDDMTVTFKEGFSYTLADEEHVSAYKNAVDIEPPNEKAPEGEVPFTEEERKAASEMDQSYVTTDSVEQFPYHRFAIQVDESVSYDSQIELVWNGASLPGRKVTMYAWNIENHQWDALVVKIAEEEDFELRAEVLAKSYVENQEVNVLVQDEIAATTQYDYTFAWLSDTQYYSESYPHIFSSMVDWLAASKEELNLKYVFHTGDLVDKHYEEYQWENVDRYMSVLEDASIPYGVLAGNHDVGNKDWDYEAYGRYFGEDRFKDQPYYGGSYQNNRGHYDLISEGGNDYIMVYLGWGIEEEGIQWVNDVLQAHPERIAILNFHEYLLATGTRSPIGDLLFEEVVKPNPNVVMVLSGHYHSSEMVIDEIDDDGDGEPDRTVYQILADYQGGPEGGQGFIRLLHVDAVNNQIHVKTYSPYLDQYNFYDPVVYPGKDEFTISLGLEPQEKRVATDSFTVNVYSETEIDVVTGVKNGEIAETIWEDLTIGNRYYWYVTVADDFGGLTRSPIWDFIYEGEEQIDPEIPEVPVEPEIPGGPETPEIPENPEVPGGPEIPGTPEDPELPGNPTPENPNDDDGNTGTPPRPGGGQGENDNNPPKQVNGPNVGEKKGESPSEDKNGTLPSTATNVYMWLVLGICMTLIGAGIFLIRKKRAA
ncbi:metallophosphoesterase [Alkalihalobacillus trypoxylicola]|uniref:LTD domain-containing protein n=1 Tax=Alkalihalobacillus trypoxylicola TaxID=519424 RepID=A0A162DH98_9BACI|nr:metallophosphoesterase [Alkalihalobacillus trypoxylicola]KYG29627.1 hypothetical protein AZF04_08945 [Alkalihalobacillus trypoxylicola]